MSKVFSTISILAIVLFAGCSKTSTESKINGITFNSGVTATINDEKWEVGSKSDSSVLPSGEKMYYATYGGTNEKTMLLFATGKFEGFEGATFGKLGIVLQGFKGVGDYNLGVYNGDGESGGTFSVGFEDGTYSLYFTDQSSSGIAKITAFDRNNLLISGEFSFTAVSAEGILTVKDGVFKDVSVK
jgi:hypothetical protein